jgi:KipI family sensor histidine kinase inhibitor
VIEHRCLPCGPRAVLIEVADLDAVVALSGALRSEPLEGVTDLVPAERTVLVAHRRGEADRVREWIESVGRRTRPGQPPGGRLVEIPVTYDGIDLDLVAATVGADRDEVVRRHVAPTYLAAFCGFQPGFAYLVGLDPSLQLPRRATPRPRVPAGSVAIASRYSGVYPQASPGGWHLLGSTAVTLWDDEADRPAYVEPGDRVRFVPV